MVRKLISSLVIAPLIVTSAEAALLTNVHGTVTVNRGDGFRPAQGGAPVAPGDRVRVNDGSADILYDNGCTVRVGAGQMVAVLHTPPACKTASSGGSSGSSGSSGGTSTMTYVYIGGGLILAGGIGAAAMWAASP
jgi:hypothetical protein